MAVGKYKTDADYDDDIDFIKDTDAVQGDPPGTNPDQTPLTGPINVVVQKIISSLVYLKNAIDNFVIERMTDSVFGTGRTATQQEAEDGTAHGQGGPLLTPQRGMQQLRGSAAQATMTRRGTAEIANAQEAVDDSNATHMMNPQRTFTALRSSQAQATETRRGTVRKASQAQAAGLTDADWFLTSALLLHALRNGSAARADESNYGVSRRASTTEARAGTNDDKHVTPSGVKEALSGLINIYTGNSNPTAETLNSGETFLYGQYYLTTLGQSHIYSISYNNNAFSTTLILSSDHEGLSRSHFWYLTIG